MIDIKTGREYGVWWAATVDDYGTIHLRHGLTESHATNRLLRLLISKGPS